MINAKLSKDYSTFAIVIVLAAMLLVGVFTYLSFKENSIENSRNLQKAAKNIEATISETFNYSNQINNHIGLQIAQNDVTDLKFILNLFNEANKIKHRNTELFSWSSFDWVDANNFQLVNSKLGIRKKPPNMSGRQYVRMASKKPWTLQLSFPALGNPSKIWVIPAATGVANKEGKYLGLISIGFDIKEFEARVTQRLNEVSSFIVIDHDLRIIIHSPEINLAQDSDFFQKNFKAEIFTDNEGMLGKGIEVDNVVFDHYVKISKYPYIVLTGFNKGFIHKQFAALILPRILELVLVMIFLLMILYLFAVRFSLLGQQKLLISSLEKTNKAKDKMMFSIAHDIKNQIYGIHGLSKLILDKKSRAEIAQDADLQVIEAISDQSEEMMYFVKDLLDDNLVEDGGFDLGKIEKCQIKSLIRGVILMNGKLALENYVELKTEIADEIPELACDPRRMKQILTNLVGNAIKYSYSESQVVIAAKYLPQSDEICIEISDQGYGMDKEALEKYLSGFGAQIDKSEIIKEKELETHGIGMSIVLRLVELHQGRIEAESTKKIGTKVRLYFVPKKLKIDQDEKLVPNILEAVVNDGKAKSILLVEDNPINIKITTKVLERGGYRVAHADNGKEALKMLDQENFDLILMDGEMPIMNGYEATIAIREGSIFKNFTKNKTIPIVALMSSSDPKTIARAKESGMNDHVEKAISKTRLLSVIEKYLVNLK